MKFRRSAVRYFKILQNSIVLTHLKNLSKYLSVWLCFVCNELSENGMEFLQIHILEAKTVRVDIHTLVLKC